MTGIEQTKAVGADQPNPAAAAEFGQFIFQGCPLFVGFLKTGSDHDNALGPLNNGSLGRLDDKGFSHCHHRLINIARIISKSGINFYPKYFAAGGIDRNNLTGKSPFNQIFEDVVTDLACLSGCTDKSNFLWDKEMVEHGRSGSSQVVYLSIETQLRSFIPVTFFHHGILSH